jgi:IMP dehydrogenase
VGFDRFTQIRNVMSSEMFTLSESMSPQEMFEHLTEARLSVAPVIDNKERLVGVITRNGALRSTIYSPAVDNQNRLLIAAAVGVNADPAERA